MANYTINKIKFGDDTFKIDFDLSDRLAKGTYSPMPGVEIEGTGNLIIGDVNRNRATSFYAVAEGSETTACGYGAHAEGCQTIANGSSSHAEGTTRSIYLKLTGISNSTTYTVENYNNQDLRNGVFRSTAIHVYYDHEHYIISNFTYDGSGQIESITFNKSLNPSTDWNRKSISFQIINYSNDTGTHAEGLGTVAGNGGAHSEGIGTLAHGRASHSQGYFTAAYGEYSHAEGSGTMSTHKSQHTFGEYNVLDNSQENSTSRGNYVEIVGNGTGENARSNARTLDWSGNEKLAGSLTLGEGTANEVTVTAAQLTALLSLASAEGVNF